MLSSSESREVMATHASGLAWRIPGMGEPGGLLSLGSQSRTRLKRLSSSSSKEELSVPKQTLAVLGVTHFTWGIFLI